MNYVLRFFMGLTVLGFFAIRAAEKLFRRRRTKA